MLKKGSRKAPTQKPKKDHLAFFANEVSRDKWARCVHDIQDDPKKISKVNPFAICTTSVGVPTPKKKGKQSEAIVSLGFPQLMRPTGKKKRS